MSTIQRVELDSTLRCHRPASTLPAVPPILLFLGPIGFRTQDLGTTWSPPSPGPLALSPIYCHRSTEKLAQAAGKKGDVSAIETCGFPGESRKFSEKILPAVALALPIGSSRVKLGQRDTQPNASQTGNSRGLHNFDLALGTLKKFGDKSGVLGRGRDTKEN
jgi:hypothetical protein